MSNSYPLVSFGLDDTRIKDAATTADGSSGDTPAFYFCTVDDLITNTTTVVPYSTFEPNFWVLDGSFHFMPTNPHIGFLGDILSDSSGSTYGDAIVIINFSVLQTINSITAIFDKESNNWCTWLSFAFYNGASLVYSSPVLNPTSTNFTFTQTVTNFNILYIAMSKTNNPYRFPRMKGFDFNTVTHLDSTKIKSAKILEEVSPISATLTMNTFELDLLLNNNEFSVTNPVSFYADLAYYNMPFMVYEVIDGVTIFMGQFYLQNWDSPSTREISFHCIDAVGLLDNIPFFGWVTSGGARSLPTVLTEVMKNSGVQYQLLGSLSTYILWEGYIEPCSVRQALQIILMACHAKAVCHGSYKIVISSVLLPVTGGYGDWQYIIPLSSEKIDRVDLLPLVTNVKYTRHLLTDDGSATGIVTIYSQYLVAGTYHIKFPVPEGGCVEVLLTGATYITPLGWNDNAAFYASILVSSSGTVTIQAVTGPTWKYDMFPNSYIVPPTIPTVGYSNVVEIDNTLTAEVAINDEGDANWLFDYFSQRYRQRCKVYEIVVAAGDLVQVDSQDGQAIFGSVERSELELVGLRCSVDIIGILI